MVRSFIVLLLLVVFFLSGTLYGMSKDDSAQQETGNVEETTIVPVENNEIELEETIVRQSVEEDVMDMDHNVHLTQKTASFLEASVQGFYEVIVQILYQITEIFF